ncbi:MAG: ATP-binding protein [Verrucomicrobiae bacterium]
MKAIPRAIEPVVRRAARAFPAVVVTGPRRAGKTFLLRRMFPDATYVLMEAPDAVARFRADPEGFLDSLRLPVILDEIQNVPEVFNHIRARIDAASRRAGRWFLTGSQESGLMRGVTESMAGRAAVLHLAPLSASECPKMDALSGGFPEVLARPGAAGLWFESYIQTYLERDVRGVLAVHDLAVFRRFLSLVSSRHGQILNKTDLAAPLGMSVPGISKWIDVLQVTGQILLVPPYFENLGKRIIKSPKLYLADSGLACHLLGIRSRPELERSPFLGPVFDGLVASEILKSQTNAGLRGELFYFRDQQGLEVDFLVPLRDGGILLADAKAARSVTPSDAAPMRRLAAAIKKKPIRMCLVHRTPRGGTVSRAVAPGVERRDWRDLRPALAGLDGS